MKNINIGKYEIGLNRPPFIIAEMSGNHNNSLDRARKIVKAAAEAGAHAVKFQTYTADTMTIDCNKDDFVINDEKSLWHGRNLYELYDEAHTPWEWHEELFDFARSLDLVPLSTPFDNTAVDFLETLDCPLYKIASFENTDIELIDYTISKGKPVIISTGMMSIQELVELTEHVKSQGVDDVILLKCTSNYPAKPKNANLRTIPSMRELTGFMVGLSDHTLGNGVAISSISYGVPVIEKHFTLARADGGVDSEFSIEPSELRSLVEETERAYYAQGNVVYSGTADEQSSKQFRRSLYFVKDIKKGDVITRDMVRAIRPGYGLPTKNLNVVMGMSARADIERGTPVSFDFLV